MRQQANRPGKFTATVVANAIVCRQHYRLILRVPGFPPTAPGQFIQIAGRNLLLDCSPEREFDWEPGRPPGIGGVELLGPLALLRRPFSLAGRQDRDHGADLEVVYRTVGVATEWMSRLLPGDSVQLIGPLGNSFELPQDGQMAVLVGGGVGIPPMLYLAQALAGHQAVAFCGAVSRQLLPLTIGGDAHGWERDAVPRPVVQEFARCGIPAVVSTEDGSFGFHGLVTEAVEQFLELHARNAPGQAQRLVVYACGPEAMMKRVVEIAIRHGAHCQVSVDRAMACGMGTCQSCCVRVRKPDPAAPPLPGSDWCYRLACTDGPVFKGADLLW